MSEPVNHPIHPEPAMVLLSGGFDSTAALAWAVWRHAKMRAIVFDYGQPHRDHEVVAAGRAAKRFGVELSTAVLADAMRAVVGGRGLLGGVEDHREGPGVDAAFVPGRNLVFLACAMAHAFAHWPDAMRIALVIGCCREDADGFPDCTEAFVDSATKTLSLAVGREVVVRAPWVRLPKARIWEAIGEADADALCDTWSCYRGGAVPCGTCHACVLRARAFAARTDHADRCSAPEMFGGDVARGFR